MKNFKNYFWTTLTFLVAAFATPLFGQCPSPENLTITIDQGPPPSATISWDVPSSPNNTVVGFLLEYEIDGVSSGQLSLPLSPTSYTVPLPTNWRNIWVGIYSVCADGSISNIETEDRSNVIIVDLILANSATESLVCRGEICPNSTYFNYSQGSGLTNAIIMEAMVVLNQLMANGTLPTIPLQVLPNGTSAPNGVLVEAFKNTTFCNCMDVTAGDYNDPSAVNTCKVYAREFLDTDDYDITVCRMGIKPRSDDQPSTSFLLSLAPNPATDHLNLLLEGAHAGQVQFFNGIGQQVLEHLVTVGPNHIDLSSLTAGVYILRFTDNTGNIEVRKLVKQ